MLEDPVALKRALEELDVKAREWPPEKFLEQVEKLVETSRQHIESHRDEMVRATLLALYQSIIEYAFACQIQALGPRNSGLVNMGMSATC